MKRNLCGIVVIVTMGMLLSGWTDHNGNKRWYRQPRNGPVQTSAPKISTCRESPVPWARILIDGYFNDWDAVPVLYSDTIGDQHSGPVDFRELKVTNDDRFLFICFDESAVINFEENNGLVLYIDTDGNPDTGTPVNGIGAELRWIFGSRSGTYYTASGNYTVHYIDIGLTVGPAVSSSMFEMAFDLTVAPHDIPLFPTNVVSIVLKDTGSGLDMMPNQGDTATYILDGGATPLPPISLERPADTQFRFATYNVLMDSFFTETLFATYDRILSAINPDLIGFVELYDHSSQETADRLELMLPSGQGQQWYNAKIAPDCVVVSRLPILSSSTIEHSGAFLIDLSSVGEQQLLLIEAHLSAGTADVERQRQCDRIMKFVRDSRAGLGHIPILADTPIMIMGDMNFVGDNQQLVTLLTGNIVDPQWGASFAPDWDGSTLGDLGPRLTELPECYTYVSTGYYCPGRLDYMIYTDSVLAATNSFVIRTEEMSAPVLSQYGLLPDDSANASDHLLVTADLKVVPRGTPPPSWTPTITATPTATNSYTSTPTTRTPTPTPLPSNISVSLHLSAAVFRPGDEFLLTAAVTNPGPTVYQNQPFVVVLDAFSSYYFYPNWTPSFSFKPINLGVQTLDMEILHFSWPQVDGSAYGVKFYGAMLNQELSAILGSYDSVDFGWQP